MPGLSIVKGFSRLSRKEKIEWLTRQRDEVEEKRHLFESHLHPDQELQDLYASLSENTISNYHLPFGLAPNFLVNDELLVVPMVIEESSVVAAAASAAGFWARNGGFHASVTGTKKTGQVHFRWSGNDTDLKTCFNRIRSFLLSELSPITRRMVERGGGIDRIQLQHTPGPDNTLYQLFVTFQTADAMGANFINSVLEKLAELFKLRVTRQFPGEQLEMIMSILSNYTPESRIVCYTEGPVSIFDPLDSGLTGRQFAVKFKTAVDIARNDPYRAVTHNKGIFNGMDAVILATGNDFRAAEACGHAFAARDGAYRGLSNADISEDMFRFELDVALAVGTVGGLTSLHPMADLALKILGNPGAETLMQVIAAAGLANNFSAVRSLVTGGIQKGHMKMHLSNILQRAGATDEEKQLVLEQFRDRTVSHAAIIEFLENLRKNRSG